MGMSGEPYILVVGGAGYIGSHMVKELSARGYRTLVFDNLSRGHREFLQWGGHVLGDLADASTLRELFRTHHIAAVMHFAAFAYVGESVQDPQLYYANNVGNTLNLLAAMREHGVDKLIFSSSCATYGIPQSLPITEDQPQLPISPYGRSKLMVEQILEDYGRAYGLRSVSLRYFNAAGADPEGRVGEWHEPETHLIPLVLEAALDPARAIKVFGADYPTPDGTCVRDYIHVLDLADAHIRALEHLLGGGRSEAYNLGNGQGVSVRGIIDCVREVTGREIRVVEAARREGDPPFLIGSSEKIRCALGWEPRYGSLRDIVQTAWDWRRQLQGILG